MCKYIKSISSHWGYAGFFLSKMAVTNKAGREKKETAAISRSFTVQQIQSVVARITLFSLP